MYLIFDKKTGNVLNVLEKEPNELNDGEDYVFAIDPAINLTNYLSIRVTDKNKCGLELIPTSEYEAKINPKFDETTEQKLARLESQNIILMDALATVFEEVLALREIVEGGIEE